MLIGMIQNAASNGLKHYDALNTVARNVANYSTYGYKAKRFDMFLDLEGNLQTSDRTDTSRGTSEITNDEFDVAIQNPNGYFMVTRPDGTQAYTRDGRFRLDGDRTLVTVKGDIVGEGITVPKDLKRLIIMPNGQIKAETGKEIRKMIGTLDIVEFDNSAGLIRTNDNQLLSSERSGEAHLLKNPELQQGAIERSNVDLYDEVHTSMRINSGVITNMRLIKVMDELLNQAIRIKQ